VQKNSIAFETVQGNLAGHTHAHVVRVLGALSSHPTFDSSLGLNKHAGIKSLIFCYHVIQ
jgi:hypothetical protein